VLRHTPEAAAEFCLTCELLFLFKMLLCAGDRRAGGQPCQALNLLRALRQSREAAALGLLQGTIGAGAAPAVAPQQQAAQQQPAAAAVAALGAAPGGALGSPLRQGAAGAGGDEGAGSSSDEASAAAAAAAAAAAWGITAAAAGAGSSLPKRMAALCRFLLDVLYK
jgi:hypothetical protein